MIKLSVLFCVAFLISCGGSKETIKQSGEVLFSTPCSGPEFYKSKDYFRASNFGESSDHVIAKKKALSNARASLASSVNTTIKTVVDNYLKALTSLIVFKSLNVFQTDNWYMWKPTEYPLNISIKGVEERFSIACLNFDTFEIKFGNFKYICASTIFTKTSIEANVNGKYISIKYNLFVDKFTNNKIFTFFTKNNTYEVLFSNILISGDDEDKNLDDVINAPMHGIVKYKNLKPNIKVKKGDVLLSLEAMKMEYSIKSPRDGIIEKILIKDGQQVTEKMKLIILKK